ncbi:hypothetical protein C2E23DRAFT_156293 [Lenzites betulinus]|nr:hypothetical protein C2E23DRAFT_156293 [Lenzites betulinus]
MLNRRKNLSHKQRREQIMLKRAVKRGDISPPPALRPDRRVRKPRGPQIELPAHAVAARRLQSAFIKLPAPFLKKTEIIASALPLVRPVPPEAAILPDVDAVPSGATEAGNAQATQLTCPRRPKWRYDMSKNEIEANEEGQFRKWLAETDAAVNAWCSAEEVPAPAPEPKAEAAEGAEPIPNPEPEQMPHAPTTFERNIEVYRQLWRVTEISQILLILLDSRCPTLHFPPSFETYLASPPHAARLRPILVLTKVDIAGPERAAAWTLYLHERFPGLRIVQVESYVEKHPDAHSTMSAASKRAFKPFLPSAFRHALVDALKATHTELLTPPDEVKANPERLKKWRPRVKTQVDWEAVVQAHGGKVGTTVAAAVPKNDKPAHEGHPAGEHANDDTEPDVLTIGVIGQPNVGKSSLLNALFGAPRVRASRTPGKTKHFQTLFWTPEVRLVDCPGLIFPNYVPMETQVLSGILPISRVSAIPLCIHHAAQLIPLERILGLAHPSTTEAPAQDKRTWRAGMHPHAAAEAGAKEPAWTTADILTAYAEKKGWITARVGRPDIKRAGNASAYIFCFSVVLTVWNADDFGFFVSVVCRSPDVIRVLPCVYVLIHAPTIGIPILIHWYAPLRPFIIRIGTVLRALAEGRIRWAFWPPGTDPAMIKAHQPVESAGIWVAQGHVDVDIDVDFDHDNDHDEEHHHGTSGEDSEEDSEVDDEDEDEDSDADAIDEGEEDEDEVPAGRGRGATATTTGRFGALLLDDDADDVDDSEGDGDQDAEGAEAGKA